MHRKLKKAFSSNDIFFRDEERERERERGSETKRKKRVRMRQKRKEREKVTKNLRVVTTYPIGKKRRKKKVMEFSPT